MPGVLAGLVGALMAAIASESNYHKKLYSIFPARAPTTPHDDYPELPTGVGRSAGIQAGYQILAVVVTLAIAIIAGIITGKS